MKRKVVPSKQRPLPQGKAGPAAEGRDLIVPAAPLDAAQLTVVTSRVVAQAQANRIAALAPNTHKAQVQDRKHFWKWAAATHQLQPHYPLHATIVLDYVLAEQHRLAPSTLRRRLATISADHRDRGLPDPCKHDQVRRIVKDARQARIRQGWAPKRQRAATLDVIMPLLASCGSDPKGLRDRAILAIAFNSGGRRPSEVCNLDMEDLETVAGGEYMATLRLTKTAAGQLPKVPVRGEAAIALRAWLDHSGLKSGAVFRGFKPNGALGKRIRPWDVSRMMKLRAAAAGVPADALSGHSIRAGFITEAGRQGISLFNAMELSGHKSVATAAIYHRPGTTLVNPAANLLAVRQ